MLTTGQRIALLRELARTGPLRSGHAGFLAEADAFAAWLAGGAFEVRLAALGAAFDARGLRDRGAAASEYIALASRIEAWLLGPPREAAPALADEPNRPLGYGAAARAEA